MWRDPIVEEIRSARKKLERDFNSDTDAFLRNIYAQQKKNKSRLVSRYSKSNLVRKAA